MVLLISFNHKSFLNRFIWPLNETLTGTITPVQSKSGSDSNEQILHIP